MKAIRLNKSVLGQAEAEAVRRVILEDGYLGMGAEVQAFEEELAAYLHIDTWQVICVNSGTAALHLSLEAMLAATQRVFFDNDNDNHKKTSGNAYIPLNLEDSVKEVLVPSLTFAASVQAIHAAGCRPVFCDVQVKSASLDLRHAESLLHENTYAIMPMHYAGNPWALESIYAFATKHKLHIIEDAAHAFGCSYAGKMLGSFSPFVSPIVNGEKLKHSVCFSFDGIKNITAGEGGAIIVFDKALGVLCRQGRVLGLQGAGRDIDVQQRGFRYHMQNMNAALGRVQLQRLPKEFAPKRRELFTLYNTLLAPLAQAGKIAFLQQETQAHVVPHLCPVRILHGQRDVVQNHLQAQGIESNTHYKPAHMFSLCKEEQRVHVPVTESLYAELLSLPLHPELHQEDVRRICACIAEALA